MGNRFPEIATPSAIGFAKTNALHAHSYVYGIDLLRFAAAIMVALFHLTWLEAGTAHIDWFGWIGVQIFFVISGFVIARSAQDAGPLSFAISRALRLYPAAWICAGISSLLLLHDDVVAHALHPLVWSFLRSLVLYPEGPFLATAYWTLPIELTFYGVIAVVLYLKAFSSIETIALSLCVVSALYLGVLLAQYLNLVREPWIDFGYGWKNITLLRHGIYFSAGIFCWLISERRLGLRGKIGMLLALLFGPIEITRRMKELSRLMPHGLTVSSVGWIPILIWLLAVAFVLASSHWRENLACLPQPVVKSCRLLGLMTYPFYLLHERIGWAAHQMLSAEGNRSALASAITGLLFTACAALLVARYGEPWLRQTLAAWIKRLRNNPKHLA